MTLTKKQRDDVLKEGYMPPGAVLIARILRPFLWLAVPASGSCGGASSAWQARATAPSSATSGRASTKWPSIWPSRP